MALRTFGIAFCFCFFISLFGSGLYAGEGTPRRKHTVLYKLKKGSSRQEKKALRTALRKFRLRTKRKLVKGKVREANAGVVADGETEEQMAAELLASGAVDFAEPDYLIAPVVLPDDPKYGSQWQHSKINSPGAWDITTGSSSVLIAVCDTGVQSNHPDLQANLQLPGFNAVDNSTNSEDVHGHGTFVAGCMGAVGNNGVGVAGVAWNIKILPIRISNETNGNAFFSDMSEGIRYAADQGAKVVNLSYEGAYSSTLDSAAQYLRGKGGLLFMAASNDGANGDTSSPSYPDFESFIAVGATTSSDTRASWSNYGSYIDVVAPGVSVYSTRKGSSYASGSGTSFASPITAGLGALIYSINPNFSPDQVEGFLSSTAVDLGDPGDDNVFGHGRIDAFEAVKMAKNFQGNTAPTAVASADSGFGDLPLDVGFDGSGSSDDGTIISYNWNFGDGTSGSGVTVTHVYTSAGTFNVTLTVMDDAGASDSDSTITITVTDPNVIENPTNLSASLSGTTVTLNWNDNANNETGYYVERGAKVKKNVTWSRITTVSVDANNYVDALPGSGTFRYRVQAFNANTSVTSGYSNEVQVKTGGGGGGGKGGGKPKR